MHCCSGMASAIALVISTFRRVLDANKSVEVNEYSQSLGISIKRVFNGGEDCRGHGQVKQGKVALNIKNLRGHCSKATLHTYPGSKGTELFDSTISCKDINVDLDMKVCTHKWEK